MKDRGQSTIFRSLIVIAALVVAACSAPGKSTALMNDPRFARSVSETATVAAVARPGARVCREMQVGIAERDWVRGMVVEAKGSRVTVRIDDPGRFQHAIGGVSVARGASVTDDAIAWTPCL